MKKKAIIKLAALIITTCNVAQAVVLELKNKSNSYMTVKLLTKDKSVIDQYELEPQQRKFVSSSFKIIESIVWQLQQGLYVKTPCYKLKVSIPWYYLFAGVFKLSGAGTYESTFFGKGKVVGKQCTPAGK